MRDLLGNPPIADSLKIYIGVDPGSTGAMAFLYYSTTPDIIMEINIYDYEGGGALRELRQIAGLNLQNICHVIIEAVHAMPGQGVSSTFKFGVSYGKVIGWVEALGYPHEFVTPAKWKKEMYDSAARLKDLKEQSRQLAIRFYPDAEKFLKRKKDHNRAESLLLAGYCKRICDKR